MILIFNNAYSIASILCGLFLREITVVLCMILKTFPVTLFLVVQIKEGQSLKRGKRKIEREEKCVGSSSTLHLICQDLLVCRKEL